LKLFVVQVDELLEPEDDDVRRVFRSENRGEEASVVGGSGELSWFRGVDVPGASEDGEVSIGTELGFSVGESCLCMV